MIGATNFPEVLDKYVFFLQCSCTRQNRTADSRLTILPNTFKLLVVCRPSIGCLSSDCWPFVGRQSVVGSCSSQLPTDV